MHVASWALKRPQLRAEHGEQRGKYLYFRTSEGLEVLHSKVVEHPLCGRNFTNLGAEYCYYKGRNQGAERRRKLPKLLGLEGIKARLKLKTIWLQSPAFSTVSLISLPLGRGRSREEKGEGSVLG